MIVLLQQELYKIIKRKSSLIFPIIIFILMWLFAFSSNYINNVFPTKGLFISGYTAFTWVSFLLIIQASTIITMEFYYGTIKNLLFRKYSRIAIITSKIIAIFIYSISVYLLIIFMTIIIKTLVHSDLEMFESKLLTDLLLFSFGHFLGIWLIISITILLSNIVKNPGVSMSLGIIMYFALSIISSILSQLIDKWEWIKWNPLNMLNISAQITNEKYFSNITHLKVNELIIGNFIYITLFILISIYVFNKKKV